MLFGQVASETASQEPGTTHGSSSKTRFNLIFLDKLRRMAKARFKW
jgi:hypothetical protein